MSAATSSSSSSSSSSPPAARPPSRKFQLHDNLFKARVITFPPKALENGGTTATAANDSIPTSPPTAAPVKVTPTSPSSSAITTTTTMTRDNNSQIPPSQESIPPMPADASPEILEQITPTDAADGRDFVQRKSSELLQSLRRSTQGLPRRAARQETTTAKTEEKPLLVAEDLPSSPAAVAADDAAPVMGEDVEPQPTFTVQEETQPSSSVPAVVVSTDAAAAAALDEADEVPVMQEQEQEEESSSSAAGPRWWEFWKPKPYTEAGDQTWIDPSGGKRPKIPTVNTPANPSSPRDPNHRFRVDDWKRRKGDRLWRPDLPDTLLPEQPPLLPPEELPSVVGHPATRYTGFATPIPKEEYLRQLELQSEIPLRPLKKLNKYPMEPPIEELPELPAPEELPLDAPRKELWEDPHPRELGKEELPDLGFYPSVQVEPEDLEKWLEGRRGLAELEKAHNPFGKFVFGDLKSILGLQGSDYEVQKQWMHLSAESRAELIRTNWKLTELKYCGRNLGRVERCKELAHDPFRSCLPFIQQYVTCNRIVDHWFSKHCQADHVAFMDAVYNIEDFKTVSVAFREVQKCFAMPAISGFDTWAW